MDVLKTHCPECACPLELPRDFDNVICVACGAAFHVREHKGAINLSLIEPRVPSGVEERDDRLAALDEEIARVTAGIDELKSREQSAPLRVGCGIFGTFWIAIVVIAIFMTLAKSYFGTWLFYLSLAVVILVGLLRLRANLTGRDQLGWLRRERSHLQEELESLEAERGEIMAQEGETPSSDQVGPDAPG